jgi:DNA-binding response OmpR family regulator
MTGAPEILIVVGGSKQHVDELGSAFPEATLVATPTLEAAVRWLEEAAHAASVHAAPMMADGLEIDVDDHVTLCHGRPIDLTEQEIHVLGCLAVEPGRARTYQELFEEGWGAPYLHDRGAVQAAVKRLRRKLAPSCPEVSINAVRGVGFRLETELSVGVARD